MNIRAIVRVNLTDIDIDVQTLLVVLEQRIEHRRPCVVDVGSGVVDFTARQVIQEVG